MATYFQPNCTLPPTSVNYVSSPSVRSTLDILFASLATIIACTYNVLHMNVPKQRQGRDRGFKGDLKWGAIRFAKTLKWTFVVVLLPEVYFASSVLQWLSARSELNELHKAVPATKETFTITHMYFADMGGFILEYFVNSPPETSNATSRSNDDVGVDSERLLELQNLDGRSIHSADGGSQLESNRPIGGDTPTEHDSASSAISSLEQGPPRLWHLRARSLRRCIEQGNLPAKIVSEDAINDKSKSDIFAKSITLIQIIYYFAEVLSRAAGHLPISQLELGVTGFVICSTFAYAFTLSKPKSVCEAIVLESYNEDIPYQIQDDVEYGTAARLSGRAAKNDDLWDALRKSFYSISPIVGAIFGAVHLLAWNFEFPTKADLWIWRGAAIFSTAEPIVFFAIIVFIFWRGGDPNDDPFAFWLILQLFGYAIARIIIVVEMFRCLFYLPPGAFAATTWTMSVPHFG